MEGIYKDIEYRNSHFLILDPSLDISDESCIADGPFLSIIRENSQRIKNQLSSNDPSQIAECANEILNYLGVENKEDVIDILFDEDIVFCLLDSNFSKSLQQWIEIYLKIADVSEKRITELVEHGFIKKLQLLLEFPEIIDHLFTLIYSIINSGILPAALIFSSTFFDYVKSLSFKLAKVAKHFVSMLLFIYKKYPKCLPIHTNNEKCFIDQNDIDKATMYYKEYFNIKLLSQIGKLGFPESNLFPALCQILHAHNELVEDILRVLTLLVRDSLISVEKIYQSPEIWASLDNYINAGNEKDEYDSVVVDFISHILENTGNENLITEEMNSKMLTICLGYLNPSFPFFTNNVSAIISLIVMHPKWCEKLTNPETISITREIIVDSPFRIKKEALCLYLKIAEQFNLRLIDDFIIEETMSILEPSFSNKIDILYILKLLHNIIRQEHQAGADKEINSVANLIELFGGPEVFEELMDSLNEKIAYKSRKIYEDLYDETEIIIG